MGSNDILKEINIKNRTCYYFHDVIKMEDFDVDHLLTDKKSYENVLAYKIPYKSLISAKPLCIKFNKTNWFIRTYRSARYLVLFSSEKYNFCYSRIRYLVGVKSRYCVCCYFSQIREFKAYSYDSLPRK